MKKMDNSVRGVLAQEICKHSEISLKCLKYFYGRDEELEKIKRYITGPSQKCMIIFGKSGSGKTYLLGKASSMIKEWITSFMSEQKLILCIRFLGTTSSSSSVERLLLNLCKQICYNLEIPMEDIPEEFVPLKNFFKNILERASRAHNSVVILLDSLELFYLNSHQNGTTSWLPKTLPPNVKFVLTFKQDFTSSSDEVRDFLNGICEKEEENLIPLGDLGYELARSVLRNWLMLINRNLTNYQWRVAMNAVTVCSGPLFLDLCFSQIKTWKSYSLNEETVLLYTVEAFVDSMFQQLENKYGTFLVGRAVSYLTASRHGLTEMELVDILCLDDHVLQEVFPYTIPEVRRLPPMFWTKIRRDLKGYLVEIETDETRVLVWSHEQFKNVCMKRYLMDTTRSLEIHSIMSDFFLGRWSNGVEKIFTYTEVQRQRLGLRDRTGRADRKVPTQPNVFWSPNGTVSRFNFRKFSELPYHLVKSLGFIDLAENVLFNYNWLHSKISGCPISYILEDFHHALSVIEDKTLYRAVFLVAGALRLSRSVLDKFPDMLGPHLTSRLLPELKNHPYIRKLIYQCDTEALKHNCLIPLKHSLPSPGGPLKFSLEGHHFSVFGCSLTNDKRYVVSISNKFISWDVQTSEVCRHIDPKVDGMMMELAVSSNNKFAATYSSSDNLIIIDIMHGDYVLIPSPMKRISGISMTNTSVIVFNTLKYRSFNFEGKHIEEFEFPLFEHDILSLTYRDRDFFVTLHCHNGMDSEFEDARMYVRTWNNGIPSSFVPLFNCIYFEDWGSQQSMTLIYYACYLDKSEYYKGTSFNHRFEIARTHQNVSDGSVYREDPIYSGVDDFFSISVTDQNVLIATVPKGFLIISLEKDNNVKKLKLPSELSNVRYKLNESNNCILASNAERDNLAIAAVRKDIFVWDYESETLLRSFHGHSGRILKMYSLVQHNLFITSSSDKTIKVWDIDMILEQVFPLDSMELKIEKIVIFESLDLAVSQTRSRIGFWSLQTGNLESFVLDNPTGEAISGFEISSDGKFFITVDRFHLLIWNLATRVVMFREEYENVRQLLSVNIPGMVSNVISIAVRVEHKNEDEGDRMKRKYEIIGRNLHNGTLLYKIQVPIKYEYDAVLTGDNQFLVIMGLDRLKLTNVLYVYYSKKGTLTHKIPLKYQMYKRPLSLVSYEDHCVAVIDSEKGNIFDARNRVYLKSCSKWTGQSIEGGKFGLAAPNSGGLALMDIKNNCLHRTFIKKVSEGVFTVKSLFTKCEKYVLYYHSGRKTLRVFRVSDGKMLSNYWLPSEVSVITSTKVPSRILVGCEDGSITMLLIADSHEDENVTFREIQSLPSRRFNQVSGKYGSMSAFRSSIHPLIKFRAVVRIALIMDRVVTSVKAAKHDPLRKKIPSSCLVS